ncbi:hypothetical protein [Halosimplex pelagicum]|uniref:Uncharacterized protein n=1 Tax=Halosimplex pelagicum TaxID=869886 RepID=A0A7D5PAG4_9EURY|nr:hypothetical protein [Halosimplex pelagicum]QLH83381.1 hypothetical protein HZS54_17855 [Halosimplex pelagicum]
MVDNACYLDLRSARKVDSDSPVANNRDKCGLCFDDGEIPDDVDEVVVGKCSRRVHLPEGHEVDYGATTPENPSGRTSGLAAKIGAEDFGPDDLEDLARGGDA